MMKNVDLEELLRDYGWGCFEDLQKLKLTRNKKYAKLQRKDVDIEVETKDLEVVHEEQEFEQKGQKLHKPTTLHHAVFNNTTGEKLEYSFRTERSTESVLKISREKGFSKGKNAEIRIKTPSLHEFAPEVEVKGGLQRTNCFKSLIENTKTQSLTWSVDSKILVPAKHRIVASLEVEESTLHGRYKISSYMKGTVKIILKRKKDGKAILPPIEKPLLLLVENLLKTETWKEAWGDVVKIEKMADVLHRNSQINGVLQTNGQQNGVKNDEQRMAGNADIVKLVSEGTCTVKYAVKQEVNLTQMAI